MRMYPLLIAMFIAACGGEPADLSFGQGAKGDEGGKKLSTANTHMTVGLGQHSVAVVYTDKKGPISDSRIRFTLMTLDSDEDCAAVAWEAFEGSSNIVAVSTDENGKAVLNFNTVEVGCFTILVEDDHGTSLRMWVTVEPQGHIET